MKPGMNLDQPVNQDFSHSWFNRIVFSQSQKVFFDFNFSLEFHSSQYFNGYYFKLPLIFLDTRTRLARIR